MPEQLDEWPVKPSPYDDLLEGSIWKVTLDEYPGVSNLSNLRNGIHTAAKRRGVKMRTLQMDPTTLVVQAKNIKTKANDQERDPLKGTRLRAVSRDERD